MVEEKIIKTVKAYLKELNEKGIEITSAFLFGSHINNNANEESDIDILLVSPQFETEDEEKILAKVWLSKIRTDNRIEPILINSVRFKNDDVSPLIGMVKEKGISIAT